MHPGQGLLNLFVLRFYCPVNPMRSCQARSVYLTTCLMGRLSPQIVELVLPETGHCPSWISIRERTNVENISWSISMNECCLPNWGQICILLITSLTCILFLSLKPCCWYVQSCNNPVQDLPCLFSVLGLTGHSKQFRPRSDTAEYSI